MRILFFLMLSISCFAASLADRLEHAHVGDYIVTELDKTISLVRIRALSEQQLVLEEVTAPASLINPAKIRWATWLQENAEGHTSWLLYHINRKTGALEKCYSYTQQGWVTLDFPLLPKMLTLPLASTPHDKLRRIGPAPQRDEEDRRSLWIPPLVFQGKKLTKPALEVMETRWPEDHSQISLCRIELYFYRDFPLPVWVEGTNGHFTMKVRTLDFGHNLASPK